MAQAVSETIRPALLRLVYLGIPSDLVKVQIPIQQQVWDEAQEFAFLTSFQVMMTR